MTGQAEHRKWGPHPAPGVPHQPLIRIQKVIPQSYHAGEQHAGWYSRLWAGSRFNVRTVMNYAFLLLGALVLFNMYLNSSMNPTANGMALPPLFDNLERKANGLFGLAQLLVVNHRVDYPSGRVSLTLHVVAGFCTEKPLFQRSRCFTNAVVQCTAHCFSPQKPPRACQRSFSSQ
jgi:hypothetical protein